MIYLRDASQHDIEILFYWANDPIVRKNSFHTSVITYEEHKRWFKRILADESVRLFILMDNSEPIGQIRLNIEKDQAEISYSISSEHRGKGYGGMILEMLVEKVRKDIPEIQTLIAKVKPDNESSNKLFIKEGYKKEYTCYALKINDAMPEEII